MLQAAAVYARYSTDKQDARSVEDQIRRCTKFAADHGYAVAGTYTDEAISGSHLERPGIQRLIADATRRGGPPFYLVLIDDTSRISREMGSTWNLIFGDLAASASP